MSQKYKRTTVILAVLLLLLVFGLYFYQVPFVHFFVTYIWHPFRDFILNPKTGWIVYGLIAPIVIVIGIIVGGNKWFGWKIKLKIDWKKLFGKKKK